MEIVCSMMCWLYDKLCRKDDNAFWKAWRQRFCSRNLKPTSVINGRYGDDNIRQKFTKHFESVVTPNSDTADEHYKIMVGDQLNMLSHQTAPVVDINMMHDCVHKMKVTKQLVMML